MTYGCFGTLGRPIRSTAYYYYKHLDVPSTPSGDLRCILVVDDNADNAWALAVLLRLEGHTVHTGGDGREAVALALRLSPTIIFMDLGMPVLDGFEAARQIRMQPEGKSIFLCAISAYGTTETRVRATEAGFDRYLQKPANFDEIMSILTDYDNTAAPRRTPNE